jgi:AraC-like DNA-binding protein
MSNGSLSVRKQHLSTDHRKVPQGTTGRVAARLLLPFVAAADELSLRVDAGLASVGLTRADLENPELRVSHYAADRLIRNSTRAYPDFGLIAAEHLLPVHLDIVEYSARSQPTLRGALEHAIRYYALLHDGFEASFLLDDQSATFRVGFGALVLADAVYEFVLAVHVMAARRMTGKPDLNPAAVHFKHPRPENIARHEKLFRCPVLFGQPQTALVYPRNYLELPLVAADSGLAQLLERHASEQLQRLGRSALLRERVREFVRQDLTGKLTAEHMAKRLGMSPRTLHRRLVDEGITYRALVDDVRREMALHCLRDPQLSIGEVGYLLGFTTSAAFHRAFRRWTGTTATQYRTTLHKAPALQTRG